MHDQAQFAVGSDCRSSMLAWPSRKGEAVCFGGWCCLHWPHRHIPDRGLAERRLSVAAHFISADPLADFDHAAEMVSFVVLHHLAGTLLGVVPAIEFLHCEDVMHPGGLINGKDLELRAVFLRVGKDDRGHGGASLYSFY